MTKQEAIVLLYDVKAKGRYPTDRELGQLVDTIIELEEERDAMRRIVRGNTLCGTWCCSQISELEFKIAEDRAVLYRVDKHRDRPEADG